MTSLRSARVRAPLFPSGSWFNIEGELSIQSLRGRLVLLDFWTFCCINCLHVIDELRALEAEFGDQLVVIGVHSPKFEHEKLDSAVAAAAARYGVHHPVFNDVDLRVWDQYAVHAWPTLVLIDQDGYIVAQAAGEGHADGLAAIIRELLLREFPPTTPRPVPAPDRTGGSSLKFPAKAIRLTSTLLVADTANHRLVEMTLDGAHIVRIIGADPWAPGERFNQPSGLALLPAEVAEIVGYDVVVADTGNHVLRGVGLSDGAVTARIDLLAGTRELMTVTGALPPVLSPWDVAWWPARDLVVIAAAGVHLLLGWDPRTDQVQILAGTTVEGLKDGPARDGWLAQPSGLAVAGDRLWFVDAETSALRYLNKDGGLETVVGEGLFDFGHVDGPAPSARLQHPLGVAVLPDGSIAIADTYNGAIRRYDRATDTVETLALGLNEPSGLVVLSADETLIIESGAHRLTALQQHPQSTAGVTFHTVRPVTELAPGRLIVTVEFTSAPGRHLDDRFGPATELTVSASPPELLSQGGGTAQGLQRQLVIGAPSVTEGVLHVSARAASCDDSVHPSCHLARQDWGIPVRITANGRTTLHLPLLDRR